MRFLLAAILTLSLYTTTTLADDSWAASVKLPEGEKPIALFNGKNLDGWEGNLALFSVKEGMIRAANTDPVPSSTYLFTKDSFRNFRLLMEVKQTMGEGYSKMHSGMAVLGAHTIDKENQYSFKGPLLMFCHDWGIWDAGGRGRVVPAGKKGPVRNPPYEKIGEWNQLEMLAVGNRIRVVSNGKQVFDFTEKPSFLKNSPLGLQLHHNKEPQEWHFRGLIVVDSPSDELVTLKE